MVKYLSVTKDHSHALPKIVLHHQYQREERAKSKCGLTAGSDFPPPPPPTDCEAASIRQYTLGRRGPHLDLKGMRHRCKKNLKERKDKYGNSYERRKLTSNDKLK